MNARRHASVKILGREGGTCGVSEQAVHENVAAGERFKIRPGLEEG